MKKNTLTEEEIRILRMSITECNNPYSEEEVKSLPYDGDWDLNRYFAYQSKKTLEENGISICKDEMTAPMLLGLCIIMQTKIPPKAQTLGGKSFYRFKNIFYLLSIIFVQNCAE